jgi:hypothetical protein
MPRRSIDDILKRHGGAVQVPLALVQDPTIPGFSADERRLAESVRREQVVDPLVVRVRELRREGKSNQQIIDELGLHVEARQIRRWSYDKPPLFRVKSVRGFASVCAPDGHLVPCHAFHVQCQRCGRETAFIAPMLVRGWLQAGNDLLRLGQGRLSPPPSASLDFAGHCMGCRERSEFRLLRSQPLPYRTWRLWDRASPKDRRKIIMRLFDRITR